MAQTALKVDTLDDAQVLQLATDIAAGVTANPGDFPGLLPTPATLTAAVTAATPKITAAQNLNSQAQAATADKDTAVNVVKDLLREVGKNADTVTHGEPAKLLRGNFKLRAASAPIGDLPAPQNFHASFADHAGALDCICNPVKGKSSYEAWVNLTPANPAGWRVWKSSSGSKFTLEGLPSGTTVQLKVRAIGAAGDGAFSAVIEHLVP
ncbi:MAG: fibronectin type III domain-containing protein [Verrucomicrobia bacterium]|nr:fibronectin type III domain-containing protein [Verrucomicrobiota bacterium]